MVVTEQASGTDIPFPVLYSPEIKVTLTHPVAEVVAFRTVLQASTVLHLQQVCCIVLIVFGRLKVESFWNQILRTFLCTAVSITV